MYVFGFSCEHEDGYPIIGVGGSSKATGANKRSGFVGRTERKGSSFYRTSKGSLDPFFSSLKASNQCCFFSLNMDIYEFSHILCFV
jgi:hypothetical protein